MNGTLDIAFAVLNLYGNQSNNYSFSFTANSTQAICISPSWASYQVNATAVYDAENYSQRHYYLVNTNLTNQTQNINLYLLEDSQSSLVQTQVIDRSINPISDVIIKAQKYYVGYGNYQTVAEGRTDFNGNDYIYLNLYNTWYKFVLEKHGQALEEFDPLTIGATTISLPVGNATRGEYWSYYGSVAYTCYYTNATAVLRCDFTDTSGLMQTVVLSVQKYGMVSGWTEFCNQTSTSTSATLLCTLNNTGTQLYKFTLYVIYPGSQFPFFTGDVDLTSKTKPYGDTGVISAIMIIGVVSMAGLPAVVGVLIFVTVAIVLVILIQLVVIQNIYYSLICIVSLVALLIWKLRGRRWE